MDVKARGNYLLLHWQLWKCKLNFEILCLEFYTHCFIHCHGENLSVVPDSEKVFSMSLFNNESACDGQLVQVDLK